MRKLKGLSTRELADVAGVQVATIHCLRYQGKGDYLGLRPKKLPNGRLLWPEDSEQQLLARVVDA